jgi:hypothetical protein
MTDVQTEAAAGRRTTTPFRADQIAKLELIVETAADVWG